MAHGRHLLEAIEIEVRGVEVVHWNPRRRPNTSNWTRPRDWGTRPNNFGDLLGPMIVHGIHANRKLGHARVPATRLLAVGSIMHFSRPSDVVWGTGINGKALDRVPALPQDLDVRAVRGPLTRAELLKRGIHCPEIYGDPAILLPAILPELPERAHPKRQDITIVPNMHDYRQTARQFGTRFNVVDPCADVCTVLDQIASSRHVLASSLHGLIVAQALGIGTRLVRSQTEPDFKYRDYYLGIGVKPADPAESVHKGLEMGFDPPPAIDASKLLRAFPDDLWESD